MSGLTIDLVALAIGLYRVSLFAKFKAYNASMLVMESVYNRQNSCLPV